MLQMAIDRNSTSVGWANGFGSGIPNLKHTFNNTQNWAVPSGVTAVHALIVAGGGGGGGGNFSSGTPGGGGGAGGYRSGSFSVVAAETVGVTVGAGGSAGGSGGAGGVGGQSAVSAGGVSYFANGGNGGGTNSVNGNAGSSGTTSSANTGIAFATTPTSNYNVPLNTAIAGVGGVGTYNGSTPGLGGNGWFPRGSGNGSRWVGAGGGGGATGAGGNATDGGPGGVGGSGGGGGGGGGNNGGVGGVGVVFIYY
jgi:hypothetical protein